MTSIQQSLLYQLLSLKAVRLSGFIWIYVSVTAIIALYTRAILSFNFPKFDSFYSRISKMLIFDDFFTLFLLSIYFLFVNFIPAINCGTVIIHFQIKSFWVVFILYFFVYNLQIYLFVLLDRARNNRIEMTLLGEMQFFVEQMASILPYAAVIGPLVWYMTAKRRARYLHAPASTSATP